MQLSNVALFFFLNDTPTTEIYTLSLHDALPISGDAAIQEELPEARVVAKRRTEAAAADLVTRSEEHTSELQSQSNLVCRLLLEKKKDSSTSIPVTPRCPSPTSADS